MTYNGCDARQSNYYFYEDEMSLTTKNIFVNTLSNHRCLSL